MNRHAIRLADALELLRDDRVVVTHVRADTILDFQMAPDRPPHLELEITVAATIRDPQRAIEIYERLVATGLPGTAP